MPSDFLDPDTVAKLEGLELRARHIVEGYVSGAHRSPFHGFSIEFSQHRDYVPGDDLRYVDWKVFGKTDKYYLKQYEEETNLICQILVDVSESMSYRGLQAAMSKFQYAQSVAAALAFLVLHQQDSIGLVCFASVIRSLLQARGSPSHWSDVVQLLESSVANGDRGAGPVFHELAERFKRRSVVVVLSDLLEDPPSLLSGLQHFRHRRHEVILFHLLDRSEIDFPFQDLMRFKGLEGMQDIVTEPQSLRSAYVDEMNRFVTEMRKGCRERGIDYVLMPTDSPFDLALSGYLTSRRKRPR